MELTQEERGVVARLYREYLKDCEERKENDQKGLLDEKEMKQILFRLRTMSSVGARHDLEHYIRMRDYYENLKIQEAYEEGFKTAIKAVFEGLK